MSNILQKRKEHGFTIIEVLIVLAIAGLIMLIVFLAVPALQRNSRNTQRKNDVSAALAAVSEYSNNNNGTQPAVVNVSGGNATFCDASPCGGSVASATAKLGYYTAATLKTSYSAPAASATDTLTVYEGAQCNGNGLQAASSSRTVAAVYGIEQSGGSYVWGCQGS